MFDESVETGNRLVVVSKETDHASFCEAKMGEGDGACANVFAIVEAS